MMMVRASVLMSWALPSISNSFFILVNSAQPHSPQTAQPINRVDDGPWPPRKHFRRLLLLALRVCLPCNVRWGVNPAGNRCRHTCGCTAGCFVSSRDKPVASLRPPRSAELRTEEEGPRDGNLGVTDGVYS